MSKVSISGNASGTGTFTIASPNGNTDRTINLPDSNGTILTTATAGVPIGGPAFSAYPSASQTITSATFTKIQLNVELFDTANAFDKDTNYRFQPNIAGYYQFSGNLYFSSTGSVTTGYIIIYKNGASFNFGSNNTATNTTMMSSVSSLIYLNGSTDYIELYTYVTGTGTITAVSGSTTSYFQAFLARSAT